MGETRERPRFWPPTLVHEAISRIPYYISDYTDAWNRKTISSALYILFVSLAPSLTFGEYLNTKTDGAWGVTEVLFATGITGVLYSLLTAQPLTIVGVSGPISILASTIYTLSIRYNINFIIWFSWANIWTAILHFILSFINAPTILIYYITRFSEDTFGMLISIIFIVNSIVDLNTYFTSDNITLDAQYFCFILTFGVAISALYLHNARQWRITTRLIRDLIADYAAVSSCLFFTLVTYVPHFTSTRSTLPTLHVAGIYVPTSTNGRLHNGWFPDLLSIPTWAIFAAILPAIIITALFWFDHCVSKLSCEAERFHLKKPTETFNYDFFVLGLCALLCGLLGIPPANGLIPQCGLHAESLRLHNTTDIQQTETVISQEQLLDNSAENKSALESNVSIVTTMTSSQSNATVLEQRVSNLLQSGLMMLVLCLPTVLSLIPRAVLSGVFLYMGITGLAENQLYHRIKLIISDRSRADDSFSVAMETIRTDKSNKRLSVSATQISLTPMAATNGAVTNVSAWRQWCRVNELGPESTSLTYMTIYVFTAIQAGCFGIVYGITWTPAAVAFPLFILFLIPLRQLILPKLFSLRQLAFLDSQAARPLWTDRASVLTPSSSVALMPLTPTSSIAIIEQDDRRQINEEHKV